MREYLIYGTIAFLFFCPLCPHGVAEKILYPEFEAHVLLGKRIEKWISQLSQLDPAQKQAESEELVKYIVKIGPIATPYLVKCLENNNSVLKRQAIEILSSLKAESAVPMLLKILENEQESPRVRETAASALNIAYHTYHEKVLKSLSKYAFNQDSRIHRASAYTLCRMHTRDSIPYLIPLLKHWDETIRYKSHQALCKITGCNIASDFSAWQKWWADSQ